MIRRNFQYFFILGFGLIHLFRLKIRLSKVAPYREIVRISPESILKILRSLSEVIPADVNDSEIGIGLY